MEQFCQLYLKAKILEIVGEYPKIYNLIELLDSISLTSPKVKKFIDENVEFLTKLEDIYITARYIPRKFLKSEVKKLFKFVKKFKKFVDEQ